MQIDVQTSYFPRLTRWHVRRVLNWINQSDLEGLGSIRVIDQCPDDPEYVKLPLYLLGFLYNGHYMKKTEKRRSEVVLYANDIYFGIPKLLMLSPLATLRIARTLAHEIGHHVIATRGYIYKSSEQYKPWDGVRNRYEEKMADAYASEVIERMLRHGYYKLGQLLAQMLSAVLYKAGIQEYWEGNYQASASLQARAHSLNPKNEDAGQCFRHAMEKLKTQSPSPLNPVEREWLARGYDAYPLSTGSTPLPQEDVSCNTHRDKGRSKPFRSRSEKTTVHER